MSAKFSLYDAVWLLEVQLALRLLWAAFMSAGQATSLRSFHSFSFVLLHLWQDMANTMLELQPGKASGSFIRPEHILSGCTLLVIHLHLLCNAMLQHRLVPS